MGSRLPYPNRFYAAVGFAASPPVGAKAVSNDTRLLLYALYQQVRARGRPNDRRTRPRVSPPPRLARFLQITRGRTTTDERPLPLLRRSSSQVTAGPCVDAKPWGWNAIETAKWQAWTTLKDMSKPDAMRHYVQTLEEENANWFQLVTDGEDPARVAEVTTAAQKAAEAMMDVTGRYTNVDADDNARAGEEIASTSERSRLNKAIDADADDSPTTTFAPTKPKSSPAPSPSKREIPTANTSLGRFLGKISGAVANGAWSVVSERVSGDVPRGRYDHAAVVVGDELYAIGGTIGGRRAGDVHALHVPTLTWRKAAVRGTGTAAGEDEPSPSFGRRSGHAAVVVGAKIVVVGGFEGRDPREADDATCDVWILDTASAAPWRWRTLALRGGDDAPRARGGHTATVVARRGDAATSIVVFGGEDLRGRLLGDVHVLRIDDDVEKGGAEKGGAFTGSWSTPGAVFAPASFTPRSHHVAAYFHGEVFVFGGVAKGGAGREVRSISHWSPYDRVGVVNADS
jgi:acyl-CoA-binding protein